MEVACRTYSTREVDEVQRIELPVAGRCGIITDLVPIRVQLVSFSLIQLRLRIRPYLGQLETAILVESLIWASYFNSLRMLSLLKALARGSQDLHAGLVGSRTDNPSCPA